MSPSSIPHAETIPPAIDRHGCVQAGQLDEGRGGGERFARRWDEVY